MFEKIIVHVGMPKTGTTALQHALYDQRLILANKFGILYPGYSGSEACKNAQHFPITLTGGMCSELYEHYLSKKPVVDLFEELILNDNKCHTAFISAENWFTIYNSRLLMKFINFIDKLYEYTKNIEILITLRRYPEWYESWFKHQVRVNRQVFMTAGLSKLNMSQYYRKYIDLFVGDVSCYRNVSLLSQLVGARNVKPILYNPSNSLKDVVQYLGIDYDLFGDLKANIRFNESINSKQAFIQYECMRRIYALVKDVDLCFYIYNNIYGKNQLQGNDKAEDKRIYSEKHLPITSRVVAEQLLKRYLPEDRLLAKNFFKREELFSFDVSMFPENDERDFYDDALVDIEWEKIEKNVKELIEVARQYLKKVENRQIRVVGQDMV